ncbi:hypothetical protein BTW15_01240 [Pseudomonas syringae pv. tomato]|uniref:Glutamate 5-kinase n=6 Tax=root TaxID=1 RepID=Q884K9_PSESM|nr:hypothetical protein [Pseudomonas syringae group genomosp. 3]AAO55597.1 hypothetical protein PSPTO_2079 [Pseudomonas syringae pv. tomato str. DC3000]KKI24521.1 prophage PSSB64-02 [Pseudomonas syringae pv. persicae]KKI25539.1 prophage PSSB64-02 [Pseudomonas syringae pv. persicae]KKI25647.1 prophage PSSB64-02 [Pseudomonas syringae pv. persicae]KPB83810.1 Uncharacterized protein AC505_1142 [Pseudomonas syringae pv. maculicola]
MGMREEIQAELAEAFDDPDGLADAVQQFTGGITLPGSWDPVSEISGPPTVIEYSGRGIFGSYKANLIDGESIKASDQQLTALTNEVTGVPQAGHKINGYDVLAVGTDPTAAIYQIQLRQI